MMVQIDPSGELKLILTMELVQVFAGDTSIVLQGRPFFYIFYLRTWRKQKKKTSCRELRYTMQWLPL